METDRDKVMALFLKGKITEDQIQPFLDQYKQKLGELKSLAS